MEAFSKGRYNFKEQTEEQKTARLRMALFPKGEEYLFVQEDMWVPVVRVGGKVRTVSLKARQFVNVQLKLYILPGDHLPRYSWSF